VIPAAFGGCVYPYNWNFSRNTNDSFLIIAIETAGEAGEWRGLRKRRRCRESVDDEHQAAAVRLLLTKFILGFLESAVATTIFEPVENVIKC
jgi:hypothetical protein